MSLFIVCRRLLLVVGLSLSSSAGNILRMTRKNCSPEKSTGKKVDRRWSKVPKLYYQFLPNCKLKTNLLRLYHHFLPFLPFLNYRTTATACAAKLFPEPFSSLFLDFDNSVIWPDSDETRQHIVTNL